MNMQKNFKEFEAKYQKKNQELKQMTNNYISLQQRNYELLKELEEKEKETYS